MNYGYLYGMCFTGLSVLAVVYVRDLLRAGKLWRLVRGNLDAAWEGGQFDGTDVEATGYLYGMNAAEVAFDMTLYAEDVTGYSEDELLPHVTRWMQERGL